ncbi:F-box only protein 36 isoform X3 [Canis lupus baileyi]|uniref:F-box only protein 36 isoform X3 n=1 Tax=Canis lupus familiaris TaxID=9615 RepID=UPI000BAA1EEF|nr:F-box only protein 36 isoform X3 [Canis lupus familiaris]XP_035573847.1 F-box only protein 36 isoform X3 [Canis lupus dingo]XP_038291612.1 F-box only protein 36 isoform X3 [Canis lupus familiaris]|eukprot:XP_022265385.1 F-box only protein 36 isoform X1 [Canis lupus familiaris]
MTPAKPRPFLVVLATPVASQDGVVAAGDAVRNCRTRPSAEQRLLPVTGHPVPEFPPREEEEQASPACVQRCSLTSAWEAEKERLSQVSRGGAGRGGERERDDLSSRVIFRWWKISLRSEYRSAKPGETKDSHGAFLENSHLQEMKEGREEKRKFGGVQIALIFGARILDYVFNLCEGKFDFLERLSDNLLLSIISYLDLEDIARLSQTSRRFAKPFKQETQKPLKYHAGK